MAYDGYEIARAYERNELVGWAEFYQPGTVERTWNLIKDDFRLFNIQGQTQATSGRKVFLHHLTWKLFPELRQKRFAVPDYYPQEIGDCHIAGTLVLMADGSEKPIEEVVTGDMVMSHKNTSRKVLRTIKKQYSGDLVTIKGKGHPLSITSTADHQFLRVPFKHHRYEHGNLAWHPIGTLSKGDKLLMPYGHQDGKSHSFRVFDGEARSHQTSNQNVVLDENMGRLIGLYMAEGGCSSNEHGPYRVEFSLSHLEVCLASDIIGLINDVFGVDAHVDHLPSKPTVLLVRCGNVDVARFFKKLIPGNVYSKRLPKEAFTANQSVRKAILQGWMDGDGSDKRPGCLVGVSCCNGMIRDMHRLARSCQMRPMSFARKKASHQTVASGELSLYGVSSVFDTPNKKMRDLGCYGRAVAIKTTSRQSVSDVTVYCLEVDNDHSFVANGYAVHNCVSFGARHSTMLLSLADILLRGDREKFRPVFSPYYYGTGRIYVGGWGGYQDGSVGSWMAKAVMQYGTLFSDEPGVPKYSGQVAKSFGAAARNGIDKFKATGIKYPVKSAALIKTWEDLASSLVNGYPVTTASNLGYSMEPGRDGFHQQITKWNHQLCIIGIDETYGDDHYALLLNSWDDVHGHLKDFQTREDLPISILRVRRKDVEKHLAQNECFAYSQFDGFPEQPIERSLFKFLSE